MDTKVLIVNDRCDMGHPYYPPFEWIGPEVRDLEVLNGDAHSIALVVFTGGADVQPSLYNETANPRCHCDPKRDSQEIWAFQKALEHHIPLFGICRGSQFLCVMAGGKLVQHTNGHHHEHPMRLEDGRIFTVSSSHHQMMIPTTGKVIGWAEPRLSQFYMGANTEIADYSKEVEVAEFPSINAYGVQYHPEIMDHKSEGFLYCQELLKKLLKL